MPYTRSLDPGASPLSFFGAELRLARERRRMTQEDLATLAHVDKSTISRVEGALLEPPSGFTEACDEAFPELNGFFSRFYGKFHRWEAVPQWFIDWVSEEERAASLRIWEPLLVPGLLQTREYAATLYRAWNPDADDEEIAQGVSARLARQAVLGQRHPPAYFAVIDEGVLRRPIGSPKIMHDQLLHLADMADRPKIKLHILPSSAGANPGLEGAIAIAGSDDGRASVVFFEGSGKGETSRDSGIVSKAIMTWDTLRSEALPHQATRDQIVQIAEELWT